MTFVRSTRSTISSIRPDRISPVGRKIPAVTVGVTRGYNYYHEDATMEIEPMFKGIAQIVGVIQAIDAGVCDE